MFVRGVDSGALADALQTGGITGWTWLKAAIIFAAAVVISRVLKWAITHVLRERIDPALAVLLGRLAGYLAIIIGFVYSLDVLGVQIGPVLGALGIAGIALAFALQDILENFVAGVLLQMQRPFTYGDQIEVNDHEGTVQAIDARLVTILTPAGELVKIPSSTVIKSDLTNYTQRGMRRTTLPVGVAYGTDLRRAQHVLLTAARSADGVREHPEPEVLLEAFGESSIDFVVRFWHDPAIVSFWRTRSAVMFAVDAALTEACITIPFPQRTVWNAGDAPPPT